MSRMTWSLAATVDSLLPRLRQGVTHPGSRGIHRVPGQGHDHSQGAVDEVVLERQGRGSSDRRRVVGVGVAAGSVAVGPPGEFTATTIRWKEGVGMADGLNARPPEVGRQAATLSLRKCG